MIDKAVFISLTLGPFYGLVRRFKVFVFAPYEIGWDRRVADMCYEELKREGCELVFGKHFTTPTKEELLLLGRDADAFMGVATKQTPITREVIENAKNLRIIAKYTIGVDDIDVEAATAHSVLVTNAPIESTYIGVAETTIAMMLALLKKLILRDKFTRSGLWRNGPIQGTYIHGGIVVGLLGFGRIAREVARLLQPWRVKLITYSPHTPPEIIKEAGVTSVDFDTLLKESDVLLVLTSLTPEKRHIIGENQLRMMKRTAYLINTARGALIDEKALVRALEEKWIAGAALDCYEEEPISRDNPLLNLENVLLSPHCASFNEGVGAQVEGVKIATENVLKALRGELPSHIINPEAIPRWKERFGQQR